MIGVVKPVKLGKTFIALFKTVLTSPAYLGTICVEIWVKQKHSEQSRGGLPFFFFQGKSLPESSQLIYGSVSEKPKQHQLDDLSPVQFFSYAPRKDKVGIELL